MAKEEPFEVHDSANAPVTGFSVFTAEEKKFVLPRKLGDRLLAFVFSCVLTGFFALQFIRLDRETPTGWLRKALQVLGIEVMFTFGILSVLALIWAVFTDQHLRVGGHLCRRLTRCCELSASMGREKRWWQLM